MIFFGSGGSLESTGREAERQGKTSEQNGGVEHHSSGDGGDRGNTIFKADDCCGCIGLYTADGG